MDKDSAERKEEKEEKLKYQPGSGESPEVDGVE